MSIDGKLRPLFRQHLPGIHWVSIETGGTGRGIPDSNGCGGGVEFWIEYKQTSGWTVDLRPEQVGWLLQRARFGGRVFIAVRRAKEQGARTIACDELYLIDGKNAREAKVSGLRGAPLLGRWEGGPSRWDWPQIDTILTGR